MEVADHPHLICAVASKIEQTAQVRLGGLSFVGLVQRGWRDVTGIVPVLLGIEGERHCGGRPSVLLVEFVVLMLLQTQAGYGVR